MKSNTIISLAILKVNWDERKKDYLDNFVPFVAECILKSNNQEISQNQVRDDLIKVFGLKIPLNVIKSILKKLRRQDLIYIENEVYYPDREKISSLKFDEKREMVLEQHKKIVEELIQYTQQKFSISWDAIHAEELFLNYLQEDEINILSSYVKNNIYSIQFISDRDKFIIASFISEIQIKREESFHYLETIVKGSFLVNSVYLPDPNKAQKKFNQTHFYFDTSFMIFSLGYAGEPRKEPCMELLNLLAQFGAKLYCFKHTVNEAMGILQLCASRYLESDYRNLYGRAIDTCEYFIQKQFTDSDLLSTIGLLEENIKSLGIEIVEKPVYSEEEFIISEKNFSKYLAENMNYKSEDALYHDTISISSIIRLRKGKESINLEECGSVFVTTNTNLARFTAKYFVKEKIPLIPPCISDSFLTNIVWLKNPTVAPDLPRKRIIADCYAAQQPSDDIWIKYVCKLEELKKEKEISAEVYYFLRTSIEAKSALIEITKGDINAFTNGTVEEIISRVKYLFTSDLQEKIRTKDQIIEKKQEIIDEYKRILDGKEQKKILLSKIIGKIIIGFLKALSVLLFIPFAVITFPFFNNTLLTKVSIFIRWLFFLISLIFEFLSILNLFTGFFLDEWFEKKQMKIEKQIYSFLEKII